VLHTPNSVPMRGFAGRLMFFGPEGNKPVKVDGTLTIYGFDEAGRGPNDVKPDRKYAFSPEQLASRYDAVKMGPAYSVWIPWDEAGGPQKEISLIVRFAPKGGRIVLGEMTRHVLVGPTLPASDANAFAPPATEPAVRPVSYESPAAARFEIPAAGAQTRENLKTRTIPLPDDLSRRLTASRAGATPAPGLSPKAAQAKAPSLPTLMGPETPGQVGQSWESRCPGPAAWPQGPSGQRAPRLASAEVAATASRSAPAPVQRPVPRGAGYPPGKSRVPGVLIAPPGRDRALSPPRPAGSPYLPEPEPSWANLPANASPSPGAGIPAN